MNKAKSLSKAFSIISLPFPPSFPWLGPRLRAQARAGTETWAGELGSQAEALLDQWVGLQAVCQAGCKRLGD